MEIVREFLRAELTGDHGRSLTVLTTEFTDHYATIIYDDTDDNRFEGMVVCGMEIDNTPAKSYTEEQAIETHLRVIRLTVTEPILKGVAP